MKRKRMKESMLKAFGGDPYESGQRDSRNGETIQWGDSWVKEMKKLYPMQWKQYYKGFTDWTSEHDEVKNIKPDVALVGQNGNVFNLAGLCSQALRKVGQNDEAKEMTKKIFKASSYDDALCIMMDYCNVY